MNEVIRQLCLNLVYGHLSNVRTNVDAGSYDFAMAELVAAHGLTNSFLANGQITVSDRETFLRMIDSWDVYVGKVR